MRTDNIKLCNARFYRSNPGHSVGSPSPLHSTLILSFVENVVEYGTISFFFVFVFLSLVRQYWLLW